MTEIFTGDPHWIIPAIVGALIGSMLGPTGRYVAYLIRKRKPHYLHGDWYGYYRILKDGKEFVGEELFTLSAGKKPHQFALTGNGINVDQHYSGWGREESNFLLLQYTTTKHDETVFVRLVRQISPNDGVLLGLWSAWDFDLQAATGPIVYSREPIESRELKRVFGKIETSPEIQFMRVPSHGAVPKSKLTNASTGAANPAESEVNA